MTNKIIIDGWNVCWKIPEISILIPDDLQAARTKFNQLIRNYFNNKNIYYKIIYDGQPAIINNNSHEHSNNIHFSKNPESADRFIINFIKKQNDKRNWTVVTSDYELSCKIRSYESVVLSSEEFILKLQAGKNKISKDSFKETPHLKENEIEFWLKIFNKEES